MIVVANAVVFSIVTGNALNLQEEWGVLLWQVLIVAAPFGLMALFGIRDRSAWLLGIILTALPWGYYLYDGIRYQLSNDTSGANIGLGLILMVSPIFISIACFALAAWQRERIN